MAMDRTFFNSANIDILIKKVLHGFADIVDGGVITSSVAQATTGMTTATPMNVTSITLTPGIWDVTGSGIITGAATTQFIVSYMGLSLVSATLPDLTLVNVRNSAAFAPPDLHIYAAAALPSQRFNVTVNTTVYLVAKAAFTTDTAGAGGVIFARKVS